MFISFLVLRLALFASLISCVELKFLLGAIWFGSLPNIKSWFWKRVCSWVIQRMLVETVARLSHVMVDVIP